MQNNASKLSELLMAYKARHGETHDALQHFPPDIQVRMLELALAGELDIAARPSTAAPLSPEDLVEHIRRFMLPF